MAGFQLDVLDPIHLEKIITKLEEKSFFRLHQTCRGVHEFMRTSQKAVVHLWIYRQFKFKVNKDGSQGFVYLDGGKSKKVCAEQLCGARLGILSLRDVKSFEELCNTLKQYRITCTGVSKYPRLNLTTEQSVTLLNILKPLQASWSNWPVNNNFEPLLLQKTLKVVDVNLNTEDAVVQMEKLLPKFQTVKARVNNCESNFDMFCLLRGVLLISISHPLPKLLEFGISDYVYPSFQLPSRQEVEENLSQFTPMNDEGEEGKWIYISLQLPSHFPHGSVCRLVIHPGTINMYFARGSEELNVD